MQKIKDYSLYLVITEKYCNGRNAEEVARCAIEGGVDIIQMREKHKPAAELIALGKRLSGLCKASGVIFIVNDDPSLAKEVGASGVHLGQEDLRSFPVEKARRMLGPGKIIGVSSGSMEQFKEANKSGADYIAYGPVFPTEIKGECVGTEGIEKVIKAALKPVVFIGGITLSNIDTLLGKGAKNISLIRGIAQARDVTAAAKDFKKKLNARQGE